MPGDEENPQSQQEATEKREAERKQANEETEAQRNRDNEANELGRLLGQQTQAANQSKLKTDAKGIPKAWEVMKDTWLNSEYAGDTYGTYGKDEGVVAMESIMRVLDLLVLSPLLEIINAIRRDDNPQTKYVSDADTRVDEDEPAPANLELQEMHAQLELQVQATLEELNHLIADAQQQVNSVPNNQLKTDLQSMLTKLNDFKNKVVAGTVNNENTQEFLQDFKASVESATTNISERRAENAATHDFLGAARTFTQKVETAGPPTKAAPDAEPAEPAPPGRRPGLGRRGE